MGSLCSYLWTTTCASDRFTMSILSDHLPTAILGGVITSRLVTSPFTDDTQAPHSFLTSFSDRISSTCVPIDALGTSPVTKKPRY